MDNKQTEWVDSVIIEAVALSTRTVSSTLGGMFRHGSEDTLIAARLLVAAALQDTHPEADAFLSYGSPAVASKKDAPATARTPSSSRPEYPRPNGSVYFARKWGSSWDVEVLRTARASSQFVLLTGPPGTGKTALVEAAFGVDLLTVVISGETSVDELVGSFIPDGTGGYVWLDGPLLVAVKEGRPILFDEILLADPKVLSVIYPLMDGRKTLIVSENPSIGVVHAKEGFYLVGAGNPNVPGARMSAALTSRFPVEVEVTTDYDLARQLGVDASMVTLASALNSRASGVSPSISWSPQMRELLAFQELVSVWDKQFALNNFLRKVPRADYDVVRPLISQAFPTLQLSPAKI